MTVNMTPGQQPHTRFRREMPKRKTKTMMGTSWNICHGAKTMKRNWAGALGKMDMGVSCLLDNPYKFGNIKDEEKEQTIQI